MGDTNEHAARWSHVRELADDRLIASTEEAAARAAVDEAQLVALIAEVDRRKLYRREACSSTFVYCVERLGLSEGQAYKRINVARLSRRFPQVLEALAAPVGARVHLAGLVLLGPVLDGRSQKEVAAVFARAAGKTKREIEKLVAELAPRPDVPAVVRRLPERKEPAPVLERPSSAEARETSPPATGPALEALAERRYKIQLTADQELVDDIDKARDMLRHRIPDGDLAKVIGWAMKTAVKKLAQERFAETDRPRACRPAQVGKRHVPADVRRAVYGRDGGRCTFVDARGRRCSATGMLEYHHREPHARGGPPAEDNLSLRCQAHNQYQAELDFGAGFVAARRGG